MRKLHKELFEFKDTDRRIVKHNFISCTLFHEDHLRKQNLNFSQIVIMKPSFKIYFIVS
jgi:hypothetical protein